MAKAWDVRAVLKSKPAEGLIHNTSQALKREARPDIHNIIEKSVYFEDTHRAGS